MDEKSVDTIDKDETNFLGYYTIEGFGSARNAMGVSLKIKDKYELRLIIHMTCFMCSPKKIVFFEIIKTCTPVRKCAIFSLV